MFYYCAMKANFKHIKNINREKNLATMFIYDEISDEKVNGRHFAHELNYLLDYEGVDVDVRINSIGGNVIHAFSIFSAITNANKNGATVNTYNDGLAASSAAWVLLAGKQIFSKDYARLMIHGTAAVDDKGNPREDLDESTKSALLNFKEMIKTVIVAKTGLASEYIEELMSNGVDNWFTADEAAALGFFSASNIEKTGFEIDLPESDRVDALLVANKAQKIINSQTPKTLQMKKVINALKLQEGASEEVVLTAVTNALKDAADAKTALETAQNSLTEANATISEQKTAIEASNKAAAVSIVENAIKEGKFSPKNETEKDALISTCLKDVDSFKNTLSLMTTKSGNVIDQIDNKGTETKSLIEKVNNRTFRELEKSEPSLLAEVKNSAKSEYVRLFNAQYNTQKTEADF